MSRERAVRDQSEWKKGDAEKACQGWCEGIVVR